MFNINERIPLQRRGGIGDARQSVDEPAKSLLRGPIREDSSRETAPIATGEPDVSRNPSRPLPQMRRRRR